MAESNRQLERCGVQLEVCDHLVASRIAIGVARESQSWKAGVATRGKQHERFPAIAPSVADPVGGVEDDEPRAVLREEIAHRESGLAGANNSDLDTVGRTFAHIPHYLSR